MKQRHFTLLIFTILSLFANAQDGTRFRTISGQLVDVELKEPVVQAAVQLFNTSDSTFVGGTVSDDNGTFSIEAPSNGTFRLKILSIGFQAIEREVTIRRNQNQELGTLLMAPESVMLQEAVVTGRAAQVVVRKDTLMYSPEAYRTPEGSTIEELIKRIPGADIDEDGNITMNGKVVKKILLDGKEFMLGDIETALKNIPVNIIQNLKFYDQQSDQSRITGIDDGNKETVLDFTIKKGMNRGYMTNLDIAGGTHNRYASRGMGSMFTDKTRLVILGNFNNKEENASWWNRRGLNARKMLGTNLNYDDDEKLKIDLSIRWNHRDGDNLEENSTENFYSAVSRTFSNSRTKTMTRSNTWYGNMRLEWKPDTLTNILMRANGNFTTNDSKVKSDGGTFDEDPYLYSLNPLDNIYTALLPYAVNHNLGANLTYGENKSAWTMLQFYRRLNPRGRNITMRVEGSIGGTKDRNVSNNEVHLFRIVNDAGQDSTYFTARYNTTPGDNIGYVGNITYSEPLWKGAHLQTGYELRYSKNKNDRMTYDFSRLSTDIFSGIEPEYREWDPWLHLVYSDIDKYFDKNLSRYSEYKVYTHNIRFNLRHMQDEYDYNVGILIQPQHTDFVQNYRGLYVDTLRIVTNLTPTVDFHYKFNDQCNLWVHYRGDTQQPDITQLLDITDDSNPLRITQGNPGLKPQFTNSLNVYFNNYTVKHKRSIVLYANYRHIRNAISNMVTYDEGTGGSITRPENINGNWNANGGFNFNTALDSTAHWNVGTDTRVRYNNYVSYVTEGHSDPEKNHTRTINLNERLNGSFRNDWLEVTLDGFVNYQHTRNELQPSANLNIWRFSYGGQILLRLPHNFEISTNLHQNSRRGYNDPSSNTNELIWNGQISKAFLKDKTLVVALNFYDLLRKQSNYERWINATSRSDTRFSSINSYAMLHVRYRLNVFGGKTDTEGRYDKKWGNTDNLNR